MNKSSKVLTFRIRYCHVGFAQFTDLVVKSTRMNSVCFTPLTVRKIAGKHLMLTSDYTEKVIEQKTRKVLGMLKSSVKFGEGNNDVEL